MRFEKCAWQAVLDLWEACEKWGLIEIIKSLDDCLTEPATFQMPCYLRKLFTTILVFCKATNIQSLWEKHPESMSQDKRRSHSNSNQAALKQMVLRDIKDQVHSMGKDIKSYVIPELDPVDDDCYSGSRGVVCHHGQRSSKYGSNHNHFSSVLGMSSVWHAWR